MAEIRAFERMVLLLLTLLVLFFCPIFLMSQRQEASEELAAMGILIDFTERWKQGGEVTLLSYQDAVEELAASGGGWRLELEHQRRVAEPVFRGGEVVEVSVYYEAVPFAAIERQLYGEGVYRMHQEDRIAVRLIRNGDSLGSRLRGMVFGNSGGVSLRYGGIVANEPG